MRPPAIEHLPPVDLPEGVTPENLTARVRIDPDGTGTLLETDAPGAARAALAAALAEARFRPATIDGTPVAATVRVAFDVAAAPADAPDGGGPDATPTDRSAPDDETAADDTTADDTTADDTTAGETTADETAADDDPAPEPVFGATASVQRARATARELELEEMRDLPGALGDPFRVLDSLPGVVAPFSGFPYVYVRGAPPAGTVYYYDGIQVPGLFHLVLGPAVIHPAMVGDIAFHPSVAPARFGRHTGGVFAGQGVDSARAFEGIGGELELRLIDVQGYVRTPVGDDGGSFAFAARYGWPGAVVSLVSQDLRLTYWDYQTRLDLPLGGGDRFQATVFGSFDRATQGPNEDDQATLQFHRAELRYLRERADFDYGVALQLGWEESQFGDVVQIVAARVGPRVWASVRPRSDLSLRVGGEAFAVRGRFSNDPFPEATDDDEPPPDDPPDD
ncbi:MAG TPA: Plug domain-containing protein, partial [Polyangiaceae bacterium LLY-WYZ-15_(1-7)]|nr:Plug domain-containing protein [Polyangiaceae bacterium LLY-WYZ-15_(1-7)]